MLLFIIILLETP